MRTLPLHPVHLIMFATPFYNAVLRNELPPALTLTPSPTTGSVDNTLYVPIQWHGGVGFIAKDRHCVAADVRVVRQQMMEQPQLRRREAFMDKPFEGMVKVRGWRGGVGLR